MKYIVGFFGGFRESMKKKTGIYYNWWAQWQKHHPNDEVLIITPHEWDDSAKAFANFIWHCAQESYEEHYVKIILVGYSWGTSKIRDVCKELNKFRPNGGTEPLYADHLVLCDPVYKIRGVPWFLNPIAMTKWPERLWYPKNCKNLYAVYQRENRPWGRKPGVKGPSDHLRHWEQAEHTHTEIDNSIEFRRLVDRVLEEVINGTHS